MTVMLIDQVLPRYDFAVTHAAVFRTPPGQCLQAARTLDLLRHPIVRALITARSLTTPSQRPRSLRIDDMVRPPLNWLRLAERPGTELVVGQVSRPWAADAASPVLPHSAEEYLRFDRPGFAKIALSLRAEPYGAASTILTLETRVSLTDPDSRRRFRRYWRLVRPISDLIRRIAFRQLAAQLAAARPPIQGRIEIGRPTQVVFDTVADERNEPRFNPRLRRVEQTTPGPIGAGTQFHAETTSMGRTVPMTIEFTDFDPPHRLASTTHMKAMDIHGVLSFDPTPRGTRMSWAWDIQPQGVLAPLRPIMIRIGRRQEQTIWRALKHHLESGQPVPDQPGGQGL